MARGMDEWTKGDCKTCEWCGTTIWREQIYLQGRGNHWCQIKCCDEQCANDLRSFTRLKTLNNKKNAIHSK